MFADDLAARAAGFAPKRVLEIAAGTGVVTQRLVPLLPPDARYTASDLAPPMLERARARHDDPRITFRVADAMALPFEDGAFDLVVCQFGVMFFPDRVAAYREAGRVLSPGGHFLFNAWDRIETNLFPMVVMEALADVYPADPPRFMAAIPHGYHDVGRIEADLAAAGFTDIAIETKAALAKAQSPRDVAIAFCQGTPMRGEIEARGTPSLAEVTDATTALLASRYGPGPLADTITAHIATARWP